MQVSGRYKVIVRGAPDRSETGDETKIRLPCTKTTTNNLGRMRFIVKDKKNRGFKLPNFVIGTKWRTLRRNWSESRCTVTVLVVIGPRVNPT